jgi:hypothetical protein
VYGKAGEHPDAYVFRKTLSDRLWPVAERAADWTESELFDALEFLWDHVSAGTDDDYYHSWGNCGFHFHEFDQQKGRERLRADLNPLLAVYNESYELTADGEVSELLKPHVAQLVETPLPEQTPDQVANAVRRAIKLYRGRGGGEAEWREAARELAGAFEYLRPQTQGVLHSRDDDLIFQLANKFSIRHSAPDQVSNYDVRWVRWIVEFYLSTLFLCFDLFGWKAAPSIPEEPRIPDAEGLDPSAGTFDPDEIPF